MGKALASAVDNELAQPASALGSARVESLQKNRKKILFVTSELADLVKAGGLGDVSAALPRALGRFHSVWVLIPGYPQVTNSGYPMEVICNLDGYAGLPACQIGRMQLPDGLTVYVVLCPELYDRDGTPYGDDHGRDWPDNHIRFARFGLAAAALASGEVCAEWQPDLVHAHDWPAGLAPAYMAWQGQQTPSIFTIHNLAYQGICDLKSMAELGLPEEAASAEGMEFYGKLSFLKAGMNYADHITTVSQTYAEEITTAEFGCGMDGLLKLKASRGQLTGIANGIDECWHPESDSLLIQGFTQHEWDGKRANARYVEDAFGLESMGGPLFVIISRLVYQKGLDLIPQIAEDIVQAGGRLAILGQGEEQIEEMLAELARHYPGQIGFHRGFNETDARRMFAGSDFLLMPSRYEPCGLSQSYAQCFGSLPIARRTGGLADTIEDGVTGFLFDHGTGVSFAGAIQRALHVYRHPELLDAMRCQAMLAPRYWHNAAKPYDKLYRRLIKESLATPVPAARGSEHGWQL